MPSRHSTPQWTSSPDMWFSLNFSPAALLDGHAAKVVNGVNRPLVVEVTEHAQIKNYVAIRRALEEIGCQLAVDDAGAGYTSLSHILELHPDFVKLDISLVRDIDTNPARQAMIAGMCHFAVPERNHLDRRRYRDRIGGRDAARPRCAARRRGHARSGFPVRPAPSVVAKTGSRT